MNNSLWIRGTAQWIPGAADGPASGSPACRNPAAASPPQQPDVSFVPPLTRRRLSPLQRIALALFREASGDARGCELFFSSRDGEISLTRRLVEDFNAGLGVSPGRFSSSVYNAAPGIWSILAKDRAPYSALAAGPETIECGLLEATAAPPRLRLADCGLPRASQSAARNPQSASCNQAERREPPLRLWAYAEETGGGYGVAALFADSAPGARIECRAGGASREPIGFAAAADFFAGRSAALEGRFITLVRAEGGAK